MRKISKKNFFSKIFPREIGDFQNGRHFACFSQFPPLLIKISSKFFFLPQGFHILATHYSHFKCCWGSKQLSMPIFEAKIAVFVYFLRKNAHFAHFSQFPSILIKIFSILFSLPPDFHILTTHYGYFISQKSSLCPFLGLKCCFCVFFSKKWTFLHNAEFELEIMLSEVN